MSVRAWGRSITAAAGLAAGASAVQLGFGYGLGLIAWSSSTDGGPNIWSAGVAWAVWVAAVAAVAGALAADRLVPLQWPAGTAAGAGGGLRRLATAVAAAVGALVTVVLVAVPAREAPRPDLVRPEGVAGGYALVGVLLGLLMALWALNSPATARNAVATTAWVWLLAAAAVLLPHDAGGPPPGAAPWNTGRLDVPGGWGSLPIGEVLPLGAALLIGAFAARRAARSVSTRVGAAASGAAGPLLVAAAHLLAAPERGEPDPGPVSAYVLWPYVVLAGITGSIVVAALAQRADTRVPAPRPAPPAESSDAGSGIDPAGTDEGPAGPEAETETAPGEGASIPDPADDGAVGPAAAAAVTARRGKGRSSRTG